MNINIENLKDKANTAMLTRLLSCIVNERMVATQIVHKNSLIKYNINNLNEEYYGLLYNKNDKLIEQLLIISLINLPLINEDKNGDFNIGLLDPCDIKLPIYYLSKHNKVETISEVEIIMKLIKEWNQFDNEIVSKVNNELKSCIEHQHYAYLNRKPILNIQNNTAIEWEQSIIEGHPTHPMNKSRHAIAPIKPIKIEDDLSNPKLIVCVVPRDKVTINGKYEIIMKELYNELSNQFNLISETLILIHELQIENIKQKFPYVKILNKKFNSKAQAALRTVVVEGYEQYNFKLAVGIKVTSALRTITPWTTHVGPHFKPIADKINDDKNNLIVIDEVASIVSNHPDSDIAKHLSCLIRDEVEVECKKRNEKVILTAALTELDYDNKSILIKALNLDTQDKCIQFFKGYCNKYLKAFLTPVYKYGLTYEAHLQNVLCRFNQQNELVGFAIRDFGGIKVDQNQLFNTTNLIVNVWNNEACQIAKDSEDMHHVAYHTMITMHLHRIIRSLNLHYNRIGWNILKDELNNILPQNCLTRKLWLETNNADFKAFITMKLSGLYRDYLYTKVPNLITYQLPQAFKLHASSPNSKFLNR